MVYGFWPKILYGLWFWPKSFMVYGFSEFPEILWFMVFKVKDLTMVKTWICKIFSDETTKSSALRAIIYSQIMYYRTLFSILSSTFWNYSEWHYPNHLWGRILIFFYNRVSKNLQMHGFPISIIFPKNSFSFRFSKNLRMDQIHSECRKRHHFT